MAKACVPVYIIAFIQSNTYGPTMTDNKRLPYNTLYRLGDIYKQSSKINYYQKIFWSPFDETKNVKSVDSFVSEASSLGTMVG